MVGLESFPSTIIHNKGGCHMIQLGMDYSWIIMGKSVIVAAGRKPTSSRHNISLYAMQLKLNFLFHL